MSGELVVVLGLSYFVLLGVATWLADYFFGIETAKKVTIILGFPIIVMGKAAEKVYVAATWPWRYRAQRLFREFFDVPPYPADWDKNRQAEVNAKLSTFARKMDEAFFAQETMRKQGGKVDPRWTNQRAKEAKKEFWSAHEVARNCGFYVNPRYTDYL